MQVAVSNKSLTISNQVPHRLMKVDAMGHGMQKMLSNADIKRPTTYVIKKIED